MASLFRVAKVTELERPKLRRQKKAFKVLESRAEAKK